MSGQELERHEPAAAIVKAIPVPSMLQELGVRIGRDEVSKMAIVMIPNEVRQRLNVINPVSSFAQADPNWTPSISIVALDKEAHTYNVAGKRGLNKQALETLGKAAGVLYTRTERVPKADLQEGERWAYRATVGFRRSDGTIEEVTRERGWVEEVEREDIEQAVRTSEKYKTPEAQEREIHKRWLAELRFGPAKTESKAINRALRAGLQVPSAVSERDLGKPFLVIGYSFTPNYDDVEVKRLLVAAGLNAQAAIYGGREVSGAIGPATDLEGTVTPAEPEDVAGEPDVPAGGDGQQAAAGDDGSRAPEPAAAPDTAAEPELDGDEPEPEPPAEEPQAAASPITIPAAAIDAAGQLLAKGEKTIAEVVEAAAAGDAKARTWLLWVVEHLEASEEDQRRASLELYASQRQPELWAQLTGADNA